MTFDALAYTTVPQLSAAETIALLQSLLTAGGDVATHEKVRFVLSAARDSGVVLQAEYFTPATQPVSISKLSDGRVDRAWTAVDVRIVTAFELGEETAAAARALRLVLFPDGLGFLRVRYPIQWTEGQAILARIAKGEHGPLLERLVGKEYVDLVVQRQAEYGDAIGITATTPEAATSVLGEALRKTREAIGRYTRVLSAFVDLGEVTEAHAAAALRPIDGARDGVRSRRSQAEQEADEEKLKAPLPAVG